MCAGHNSFGAGAATATEPVMATPGTAGMIAVLAGTATRTRTVIAADSVPKARGRGRVTANPARPMDSAPEADAGDAGTRLPDRRRTDFQ